MVTLRIGSAASGAILVLGTPALAQEDAAALVSASEEAAEQVAAHAETIGRGFSRIPEALTQILTWLAGDKPPLQAVLMLLSIVALAILTGYALEAAARRFWHSRGSSAKSRKGMFFLSLFFLLPTFVFFAFKGAPIRSTALALVLAWGVVHIIGTLLRTFIRPERAIAVRRPLRWIQASLAVLAFSYVGLGVTKIAGGAAETRLALATLLCLVFLGACFAVLKAFKDSLPPGWEEPYEKGDVIVRYLRPYWYVIANVMLALTGVVTMVASIREGGPAFAKGAASILLLGAVLVALFKTPDNAVDGVWRQALRRCMRLAILAGYWLGFALIWGINPLQLATDRLGGPVVRAVIDIGIAGAVALMLWEIARTALDSYAPTPHGSSEPTDEPGHRKTATRIQTFLPLLRAAVAIFIAVVAGMAILSAMGVNIGPMLAGAGVIGIAVGFGSQTLVKDVISGLFFLADDAFRLGEFIEIGNAKGTVEKMSIRSLRLRHPRGQLYTVPFGEIRQITNHSRDYVIVKLEFTIAFDTDLVKAKKLVKQIASELSADEELAPHLLQPLKFQGMRRMEQYGLVVGVKFTAKPGEQWGLRREVFHRIRDAFAREGIEFARPQIVVKVPPGAGQSEEVKAAALAAVDDMARLAQQNAKAS